MVDISIRNKKDIKIKPIIIKEEDLIEERANIDTKDYYNILLEPNINQFSKIDVNLLKNEFINYGKYISFLKELGVYPEDDPFIRRVVESIPDIVKAEKLQFLYLSAPSTLFRLYGPYIAYEAKKYFELDIYDNLVRMYKKICEEEDTIDLENAQKVIDNYVIKPFEKITENSLEYMIYNNIHEIDIYSRRRILINKKYRVNLKNLVREYIETKNIYEDKDSYTIFEYVFDEDDVPSKVYESIEKIYNAVMKDFFTCRNLTTVFLKDIYLIHNFLWNLELSKYDSLTYNGIVFNINTNYLKCNLYEDLKLLIADGYFPYFKEDEEINIDTKYLKNLDIVLGISEEEKDIIKNKKSYPSLDIILNSIFPSNYILSPDFKIPYYKEASVPKPISFLKYYKLLKFEKESESLIYNAHYISSKIKHKIFLKLKEKYEDYFNLPSRACAELKFLLDTSIYDKIKLPEKGEEIVEKYVQIYSELIEEYLKNSDKNKHKIKISKEQHDNFEFIKAPIFKNLSDYIESKYTLEEFINKLNKKGIELDVDNIESIYENISPYYILLASLERDIQKYCYEIISEKSANFKNLFISAAKQELYNLSNKYHLDIVEESLYPYYCDIDEIKEYLNRVTTLSFKRIGMSCVLSSSVALVCYIPLTLLMGSAIGTLISTGVYLISSFFFIGGYYAIMKEITKDMRKLVNKSIGFYNYMKDYKETINIIYNSIDNDYHDILKLEKSLFEESSLIIEKNFKLGSFIINYKDYFDDEMFPDISKYIGTLEEELKYESELGGDLMNSINWYALEVIKEWSLNKETESSKYKLYYLNPKGISILNNRVPIDILEDSKYIVDNILGKTEQKIEISSITKEYKL